MSVMTWDYDELGRLKQTSYPDTSIAKYDYIGGSSLLSGVAGKPNSDVNSTETTYATYSGYNIYGQPEKMSYGNDLETDYTYSQDARSLLSSLKVSRQVTAGTEQTEETRQDLLRYGYGFDDLGNITRITDHVISSLSTDFTYDHLNRLKSAARDDVSVPHFRYAFDGQGNLLKKEETTKRRLCYNAACSRDNIATNKPHHERIWANGTGYLRTNESYGFTWSASGNLLSKTSTSRGSIRYRYDAQNMLRSVDQGSDGSLETQFFYDEAGQRFLKMFTRRPSGTASTSPTAEADGLTSQSTSDPEIRTFYLGGGFEYREKWESDDRVGYQVSKFIMGAGGQKVASITGEATTDMEDAQAFLGPPPSDNYYILASLSTSFLKSSIYLLRGIAIDLSLWGKSLNDRFFGLVVLSLLFLWMLWVYIKYVWFGSSPAVFRERLLANLSPVLIFALAFVYSCGNSSAPSGSTYRSSDTDSLYDGLPMGTYYYSHDHLGSSSLVTDEDGNEVIRTHYTPYGEVESNFTGKYNFATSSFTQNAANDPKYANLGLKFTGQEYDPESALYYYKARYYDPSVGVFTTADTLIPSSTDPMAYHRYMYVRGNPLIYTDPSGHGWFSDAWDWVKKNAKKVVAAVVAIVATVVTIFCVPCQPVSAPIALSAWGYFGRQFDDDPTNDNDIDLRIDIPVDFGGGGDNGRDPDRGRDDPIPEPINDEGNNSPFGDEVGDVRGCDKKGCGDYGAPRKRPDGTKYPHGGIDLIADPGATPFTPFDGYIEYPGRGDGIDLVSLDRGTRVRVLYVDPNYYFPGTRVYKGSPLGTVRDLRNKKLYERYGGRDGGMTNHIHVNVIHNGRYIDPTSFLGY